jgi:hypothetical protein
LYLYYIGCSRDYRGYDRTPLKRRRTGVLAPDPGGLASLGDETMNKSDDPSKKGIASTNDDGEINQRCPRCETPITGIQSRGPDDHVADPCGCFLSAVPAETVAVPLVEDDAELLLLDSVRAQLRSD